LRRDQSQRGWNGRLESKSIKESGKGAAAVTKGVLGFEVDFGHGVVQFGQVEEGVVAEAASSAGGFKDESVDVALGGGDWLAITCRDQDAAVTRSALGCGDTVEALKQHHIVPDVGVVIGVGGIGEACIGGKAGGADSGCTVERVDFKAGIVGQDQLTGGEVGVVDSLDGRIGFKGSPGLVGCSDVGEAGEWIDLNGMCGGGGAEIAEFALAGRGDEKAESHKVSVKGTAEGFVE
jgi:hypothetical protein